MRALGRLEVAFHTADELTFMMRSDDGKVVEVSPEEFDAERLRGKAGLIRRGDAVALYLPIPNKIFCMNKRPETEA